MSSPDDDERDKYAFKSNTKYRNNCVISYLFQTMAWISIKSRCPNTEIKK